MSTRGRRKTSLASALASVDTPVYAIDHRRRYAFFNAGCERLTGWTADDLLGRVGEYRSDAGEGIEALANALCPPPEVFEGEPRRVPVFLPRKGARAVARELVLQPLVEPDGRVPLVLGFVAELPVPHAAESREPATVRLHAELAAARAVLRRRYGRDTQLGRGPAMRRVLEQVDVACRTTSPVLFTGERGTGRKHAAHVVHGASTPPVRQFVPLDCAAVAPAELKQALRRLLREETGPATGLQPGTLLLENVDALPRDLQTLVVEGFVRDGTPRPTLRLMATTANGPEADRRRDVYVDDFYFLISTFVIELPRFVDRLEDLELLATAFLEEGNRGGARQLSGLHDDVWQAFRRYHWPGNVAELRNVIAAAREQAEGTIIRAADLPFAFRAGLESRAVGPVRRARPQELDPLLERVESEQIRLALVESRFNKSAAAELLGITRTRLYRRMEQLGIGDAPGAEASPATPGGNGEPRPM